MYYQTYMKLYYLEHKERIKANAKRWAKDNPGKVRTKNRIYREEHKSILNNFIKERMEVIPFEKRVSQGLLTKMKENSQVKQNLVKHYEWQEDWIPRKKILEGG